MKKLLFRMWPMVLAVLLVSCSEVLDPNGLSDQALSAGTKSPDSEYYYWYDGKRINLTVNNDYVNILVDTNIVSKSNFSELCSEMGLEAKTNLDSYGLFKAKVIKEGDLNLDYQKTVDALRADSRVLKVLPYFERGHGAEPIGTSHLFYVQLKVLSDEVIPFFEREYDVESLKEEAERLGIGIVKEIPYVPDWYIVSIKGSEFKTSVEAANAFYESGRFVATDPAFMFNFHPSATNDPMFFQQWGLKNTSNPGYDINVEGAWSITTGSGINIAVLDRGPDPNHIDLASNYYYLSYDADSHTIPAHYDSTKSHGTRVAGIAAAVGNNNNMIAGVAYNSKIIRVSHCLQTTPTVSSDLANGIAWAWSIGADVINNSWGDHGGNSYNQLHSSLLESVITTAINTGRSYYGCVIVFSSGNFVVVDYPANSIDRVLTVGGINNYGYRHFTSGYGPSLDVVAPGVDIISTIPDNQTDIQTGTSFSAPFVSGVAALVLAANPYLSSDNVVSIIQRTANRISPGSPYYYTYHSRYSMFDNSLWNQEVGHGLVDASAAVSMAQDLCSPSINDTGMDITLSTGPTMDYHSTTVSGGTFPVTVYADLLPPQVNSNYTYYWFISRTGYPSWEPSMTYTYGSSAHVNIPAVSSPCTLYIQCMVYNGSSLVDIPSYTINVNP
jgi:subtilisin family serine protease